MPTISPQVRATIGGSPGEARPHRTTVNVSTGMNLPKLREMKPDSQDPQRQPDAQKTGQSDITEESKSGAVTLSPQLTALARRQQKLQQEIHAHREREAAFAAKEADYVPKSSLKAKMQENAQAALQELGLSYDELTQLLLDQQQGADPVKKLATEVEQLKKKQEETVNNQYEATLKQYKAEAETLTSADPKAFHFINKGKHHDAVVQLIVDTWEENPDKVLTVDQASKEVEEVLRENAKAQAAALKELEPPQEEKTPEKKLPPPQRAGARTLTQQVESAPTRTYGQFQHLSMKERIAQAVARAQK